MAAAASPAYKEGDFVLAYHGPLLYPAKILKVDNKEPEEPSYFVHYDKWSKKWDEWVKSDRLEPNTTAKQAYAADLKKKVEAEQKAKDEAEGKRRKGGADSDADSDEEPRKDEVKIKMSGVLKKRLIQDWECIIKHKQLAVLPRNPSIAQIFTDFIDSKKRDADSDRVTREVCNGLKLYFDRALGSLLLYKHERAQAQRLLREHKEKAPSDVFGVEHLLRLFVKLPSLLVHVKLQESEASVLQNKIGEFLKWLEKKVHTYPSEYKNPGLEYAGENAAVIAAQPPKAQKTDSMDTTGASSLSSSNNTSAAAAGNSHAAAASADAGSGATGGSSSSSSSAPMAT